MTTSAEMPTHPCPCYDPDSTDENGCHTAPDGSCISAGPCIHTPPASAAKRGHEPDFDPIPMVAGLLLASLIVVLVVIFA